VAEPVEGCTHPWLRVTCGVCGEAVDALGEGESAPGVGGEGGIPRRATVSRIGGPDSEALFIVARGHPELMDQLRVVMGHESGVNIIEDRRQRPREEVTDEKAREIRKRLREEGPPDQG
jgi:hypothetical protein